jgi:hypothetical protein
MKCITKACFTLGVKTMFNPNLILLLVQKLKSIPRALHKELRLKEKKKFNLPQAINKCWTLSPYIGPKANKRIPSKLGGQFATFGAHMATFINILTSMF